MAGIEIRGLSKAFPACPRALEAVDLEVAGGELLVVVGPSGSGKTTLLRLIAGLDTPTAGEIRIDGKELTRVPPHRRSVALVFQNLALYQHLRVRENLAFGLSQLGVNRERSGERGTRNPERGAEQRVVEVAQMLGIDHLLDRYPAELSGGEQQRVAVGRAIVRRPRALLLDEPLSSLDAPVRRTLRQELKQLQRKLGVPTIYVTHDPAEALLMGDRIAVLGQGRLQQIGLPGDVCQRPANRFVAEFFDFEEINNLGEKFRRAEGAMK